MRKLLQFETILLCFVLFASCGKDPVNETPYLRVNPSTVAVTAAGGTRAITLETNKEWTVEIVDDTETAWISASSTGGTASTTVNLTILPNSGYARTATVIFKTLTLTAEVAVSQEGKVLQGVSQFSDDFSSIVEAYKVYTGEGWEFYTSDNSNVNYGFKTRTFSSGNDTIVDKYLDIAPYNSSASTVTAYAKVPAVNVKDAPYKTLSFATAWYYQTPDNSKFDVVVSTDFAGDFTKATWTTLYDATYQSGASMNLWKTHVVDLSGYATQTNLHIAFRYIGKSNTYRLDDIKFGYEAKVVEPSDPSKAELKSIAYVRAFKSQATNGYTVTENIKIRGTVVSDRVVGNIHNKSLVIQDATSKNSGITVRFSSAHSYDLGDEVEVCLIGGTISIYGGLLQAQPSSDNLASKTSKANAPLSATKITVSELKNGDYESMYVYIEGVQVLNEHVGVAMYNSTQKGNIKVGTSATDNFFMYTTSYATFKDDTVPSGNGPLKGVAGIYATSTSTSNQISPQSKADFGSMTGTRNAAY